MTLVLRIVSLQTVYRIFLFIFLLSVGVGHLIGALKLQYLQPGHKIVI